MQAVLLGQLVQIIHANHNATMRMFDASEAQMQLIDDAARFGMTIPEIARQDKQNAIQMLLAQVIERFTRARQKNLEMQMQEALKREKSWLA